MIKAGIFCAASVVTALGCSTAGTLAQTQLESLHEIKLPVPSLRGIWWSAGTNSRWVFSIAVAHDDSVLVYEADKNGNWPLAQIRDWWTEKPTIRVMNIPGWSSADGKNLQALNADLQVTPDGRYAVAFAEAEWRQAALADSNGKPSPTGAASRKPDTIITLIDIEKWKVASTFHTASLDAGVLDEDRVLSNGWLALRWGDREASRKTDTLSHRYALLSLPDLKPGPECTETGARGTLTEVMKNWAALSSENDAACANLLKASSEDSMRDLNKRINPGIGPATPALNSSLMGNSFFGTSSNEWYGLDSVHSELSIFDKDGKKEKTEKAPHLLCESQPVQGPAWDCSCSVEGVSEEQKLLLVYCRTAHDNFFGSEDWLKQWLSVFRSDNLSEVSFVRMSRRNEETREAIAAVDGRAYVLAVSLGQTLRVYPVPEGR